jgi:O-antigen/teichoic acid export membrane protein
MPRRSGPAVIVGNASSMIVTAVMTSGLGVVFWWLAARHYSPASVGLAAASISATQFLGSLAVLGFGTLLISELPSAGKRQLGSLVATALLVAGVAGAVLGAAFALAGPLFARDLAPLRDNNFSAVFFAVAVSTTALGFIVDQLAVGLLRGELQVLRNSIYSIVKLGALVAAAIVLARDDAMIIFGTWPLAAVISLTVMLWLIPLAADRIEIAPPRRAILHQLGGAALRHHALNLAIQLPSLALPVLVTAIVSATSNGYFYIAWMVAGVAVLPQIALATTLFAVGVHEPAALAQRTRLTLALAVAAGLAANILVQLGGDFMLGIFGRAYAEEASLGLRLLTLSVFPLVIKNHYIALVRVQRRIGPATIVASVGACIELVGAAIGAMVGDVPGLSIGWLIGLTLEAVWMLPVVYRAARQGSAANLDGTISRA